jgi:hypothetical protein
MILRRIATAGEIKDLVLTLLLHKKLSEHKYSPIKKQFYLLVTVVIDATLRVF